MMEQVKADIMSDMGEPPLIVGKPLNHTRLEGAQVLNLNRTIATQHMFICTMFIQVGCILLLISCEF